MDFDKLDKMSGLTGEPCANWQAVVEEYKRQRTEDLVDAAKLRDSQHISSIGDRFTNRPWKLTCR